MLTQEQGESLNDVKEKASLSIHTSFSFYIILVQWNGPDIVVFNDVIIKPPYQVENVEATANDKQRQVEYVKKLVLNRHKQLNSSGASSATSSETSSTKN
jgi:hypothetical protein